MAQKEPLKGIQSNLGLQMRNLSVGVVISFKVSGPWPRKNYILAF